MASGALCLLIAGAVWQHFKRHTHARTKALANSLERANHALNHQALHDPLTRLHNRRFLEDHLVRAFKHPEHVALLHMNLDGFKVFNDAFGHRVGDRVLNEVARRLSAIHDPSRVVARIGGDDFAVLMPVTDSRDAEAAAADMLALFDTPVIVYDQKLRLSASIGVALYPESSQDPSMLLSHADTAMSHAKDQGRNRCVVFDPGMGAQAHKLLQLSQALGPAMQRKEFHLLYQPKYDANDESLVGVEALIRWNHPQHGIVGPDVFIPLAERTGLINELGVWILDEACRQLSAWHERDIMLQMSVNLSVQQFCSFQLIDDLRACLARYTLQPEYLILEITESIAMQDVDHSLRMLEQMRELGVRISIDDFGTGYSSLAYLKRLLAHELKIDRSFVQNLQDGKEDAAIVAAIIGLGHTLGMTVTAEGVETLAQKDFLQRQHCTLLQGYLLGRPVHPDELHLTDYHARRPAPSRDKPRPPASAPSNPYQPAAFSRLSEQADVFHAANTAAMHH